MFSVVLY